MGDSHLRSLEREYRSSRSPEARGRYLAALERRGLRLSDEDLAHDVVYRVKTKELLRDRVRYALSMGSKAAALAAEPLGLSHEDLATYVSALKRAKVLTDSELRDVAVEVAERLLAACPHELCAEEEVRGALVVARDHARGSASRGELKAAEEGLRELLEEPALVGMRNATRWRRAVVECAQQATRSTAHVGLGGALAIKRAALRVGVRYQKHDSIDAAEQVWLDDVLCQYLLGLRSIKRTLPAKYQASAEKAARTRHAKERARQRAEVEREAAEIAAEERAEAARLRKRARASERRASKKKSAKKKTSKKKTSKKKASKQKASKQKASKQKASTQKASKQKSSAAKKKAAKKKASKKATR